MSLYNCLVYTLYIGIYIYMWALQFCGVIIYTSANPCTALPTMAVNISISNFVLHATIYIEIGYEPWPVELLMTSFPV